MEIDYDCADFVLELSTVCRSDAQQLITQACRPSCLNYSAYEHQTVLNLRQSTQKQNLFPK